MKNLLPILIIACTTQLAFSQSPAREAIHYISLNNAIQEGQYDGVSEVNWVRDLANFGVGSEEKLRSEVIVVDGSFYKIDSKGEATLMKGDDLLAYAALKDFSPDITVRHEQPISFEDLQPYLNKVINTNAFIAIRIDATFESATYRCYEEQEKPFKPLDNIPEIVFTKNNIKGSLIGFYTPASASVMNTPTYHFHFIDDERKTGGHFKSGMLRDVTIHIDYAQAVTIHLPPAAGMDQIDLSKFSQN